MRRFLILCGCLLAVLVLATGSAPATRSDSCTWGASSVMVEVVDGKFVQSEPATTGCIPG
jgi:hypothetical protein